MYKPGDLVEITDRNSSYIITKELKFGRNKFTENGDVIFVLEVIEYNDSFKYKYRVLHKDMIGYTFLEESFCKILNPE